MRTYELTLHGHTFLLEMDEDTVTLTVDGACKESLTCNDTEQANMCFDDFRACLRHVNKALYNV